MLCNAAEDYGPHLAACTGSTGSRECDRSNGFAYMISSSVSVTLCAFAQDESHLQLGTFLLPHNHTLEASHVAFLRCDLEVRIDDAVGNVSVIQLV